MSSRFETSVSEMEIMILSQRRSCCWWHNGETNWSIVCLFVFLVLFLSRNKEETLVLLTFFHPVQHIQSKVQDFTVLLFLKLNFPFVRVSLLWILIYFCLFISFAAFIRLHLSNLGHKETSLVVFFLTQREIKMWQSVSSSQPTNITATKHNRADLSVETRPNDMFVSCERVALFWGRADEKTPGWRQLIGPHLDIVFRVVSVFLLSSASTAVTYGCRFSPEEEGNQRLFQSHFLFILLAKQI